MLSGCANLGRLIPSKQPAEAPLVIPDFDSAKDQYGFASMYKAAVIPAVDPPRRKSQAQKIIQCYQQVANRFPDDPNYTPVALLEIADETRSIGDVKGSEAAYRDIISRYPQNEYVQARGTYSVARCCDARGDFETAKQLYRQIHEQYYTTQSPAVRDIVMRADKLYYTVREKKPAKRARAM